MDEKVTDVKDWNEAEFWIYELVQQSKEQTEKAEKRDEKHLKTLKVCIVIMALIIAALIGTNAYWIYIFQSYDIVTQDGSGLNNYNTGNQGDVLNESKDTQEEKRE